MNREYLPGAWIVEAAIVGLVGLLLGRALGIPVTVWSALGAGALGVLIVWAFHRAAGPHGARSKDKFML